MEPKKSALVRIVLRIFGLVFGVVVLGCIADKLYVSPVSGFSKVCYFNRKDAACDFGIACGALALVLAIIFCVLDLVTDVMGNAEQARRPAIIAGSALAIVMGIMWLACFGYLTKLWVDVDGNDFVDEIKIPGQATLGFSFLSIPIWFAVAIFGFVALRGGATS
ncbi:synaptogyrin-1-like [Corticium candelabrum]|uniref:synaptogyrin-1-like n=1 Tax=Corticium candelabrum TaxID=121492 RepID=UPI002E36976F|nr:synaptogyrin-1-like [Corticium candelabrum]